LLNLLCVFFLPDFFPMMAETVAEAVAEAAGTAGEAGAATEAADAEAGDVLEAVRCALLEVPAGAVATGS